MLGPVFRSGPGSETAVGVPRCQDLGVQSPRMAWMLDSASETSGKQVRRQEPEGAVVQPGFGGTLQCVEGERVR